MADTAGIVCAKCGAPGSVETMTCAKCGGRVVHICPHCKFHNAAAKNFCDVCGEALRGARKAIPMPERRAGQVEREDDVPPLPAKAEPPARREEPSPRREEPPPRREEPPQARLPRLEPPKEREPEAAPPPADKPLKLELRAPERAAPPPDPGKREDPFADLPRTVLRRLGDEEAPPPAAEPPKRHEPPPAPRERLPEPRAPMLKRQDTIHLKPPAGGKGAEDERADALRRRLEAERAELQKLVKKEAPPPARGEKPREHHEHREHRREDPRREAPRREAPPATHYGAETLRRIQSKPVFSTLLGLFLLVSGAILFVHTQRTRNTPAKTILKTAGDYLFALKQKNLAAAYAMLSEASQRSVSQNRFAEMQDPSVWTFDDVRIDWITDKAAFVRFKLLVSAQPLEEEGILFVRESGQWRRSYWWHLADDIEAAIEGADYPRALRLTNDALGLDPYDPMTNAYACEVSFRLGNNATAEPACQKALKSSEKFPARLGPEGVFQLHLMLADMYRRSFRKPADAEREFAVALAFPGLSAADRCDILNARGDMRYELAAYPQALEDFRTALGSCTDPVDRDYAERSVRLLSGEAGAEAVTAAQSYRMPGYDQTLLEWRQSSRTDLSRRLNIKNLKAGTAEKETWSSRHDAGAVYGVSVRDEVAELLTAKVDLWTYQVKVELHAQ